MDPREVESLVRDTYRSLLASPEPAGWGRLGDIVSLAELRSALPGTLPREQVDAALQNLAGHSDVHIFPRSDQDKAHPNDRDAALLFGGKHQHAMMIDDSKSASLVVERLTMNRREQAESMVAALDDGLVVQVAALMNVEHSGDLQQLREQLVNTSVSNQETWLAAATREADDGTLLYRAETDPGSLSAAEIRELGTVAQRHAGNPDSFAPIRDRAERWLAGTLTSSASAEPAGTAATLARSSFAQAPAPSAPTEPSTAAAGGGTGVVQSTTAANRSR